ncbi:MAG: AhpC/TSA family protein [Muribaculaceae bacterium]|nr:AhpC/TSA family protein [Muribaculaceae bacterium]
MKSIVYAITAAALLSACSGAERWKVEGKIDEAQDKVMYLESVNNGLWSVIDSVSLTADGTFSLAADRALYPDIYRLSIDGRSIYFPIDSTETVTIAATLPDFDTAYTLSGSTSAEMMNEVNARINKAIADGSDIAGDSLLKRDVAGILQRDWGSIVAYYAINKSVGTTPLFDPSLKFDRRIINAVANNYANNPDDPRAAMLKKTTLNNRMIYEGTKKRMEVNEMLFPEIELKDKTGTPRSLTKEWEKGKVMVLNFTLYGAQESPAFNIALAEVYDRYKDQGLEIYQVVCDDDEYLWLNSAKNIPWISVYNAPAKAADALLRYNVGAVPTTFIISRDGRTLERVEKMSDLPQAVAKFF